GWWPALKLPSARQSKLRWSRPSSTTTTATAKSSSRQAPKHLANSIKRTIGGRAMGLNYKPLEGKVTGQNTGKKFLVRSLTGVGTILAATVGVQSGLGVDETITNNMLLRERLANNVALAGEQQMNELAYHQNIVVTVPGNTRFYIVLAKSG